MKLGYLLSIASLLVTISGLPTYEIEKRDFSLKDKFHDVKENAEDSEVLRGSKIHTMSRGSLSIFLRY